MYRYILYYYLFTYFSVDYKDKRENNGYYTMFDSSVICGLDQNQYVLCKIRTVYNNIRMSGEFL